jgi:hypothetical protein
VQCIVYDGHARYTPPAGWALSQAPVPDCVPVMPEPPRPSVIDWKEFLHRFTMAELQGAYRAATLDTTGAIGALMSLGQADGTVDLGNPLVVQGVTALVQAGALTQDRATAILTP